MTATNVPPYLSKVNPEEYAFTLLQWTKFQAIAIMLCPYRHCTPAMRRAKAEIIGRAYRKAQEEHLRKAGP